jgi:hypothetical protein
MGTSARGQGQEGEDDEEEPAATAAEGAGCSSSSSSNAASRKVRDHRRRPQRYHGGDKVQQEDSGRRVVLFSHIITEIDTIVEVLDSVVDATKAKETLKLQLSGFKDQIAVALEESSSSGLKKKKNNNKNKLGAAVRGSGAQAAASAAAADDHHRVDLTDLQNNIDLVAQSLGIEPVWKSSKGLARQLKKKKQQQQQEGAAESSAVMIKDTKCAVGIGFANWKQKLQKMFCISTLRSKTMSAFSLR